MAGSSKLGSPAVLGVKVTAVSGVAGWGSVSAAGSAAVSGVASATWGRIMQAVTLRPTATAQSSSAPAPRRR